MPNFVFISPTFPDTYYQFPRAWKMNGGTSLCIGEDPYEYLSEELRQATDEYYQVRSLGNYDEMYRAVAWFAHKHGKIDWLESNNEFWLKQDAQLRTDFNITTGDNVLSVDRYKSKSGMKEYYAKAGVKTARWSFVTTLEEGRKFVETVGYPIIVKPDCGVGANATWKIQDDAMLEDFYRKNLKEPYIMEEFVNGEIWSYDGLTDRNGKVIFRTVHVYKSQIMDVINEENENFFYSLREIPKQLDQQGEAVLRAFDLKARFFHTEYFRLTEGKEGLGESGEFLGLEVNMRPPGGYIPDMMNFANDIDIFRMYADMCMNKPVETVEERPFYCAFFGRRDRLTYKYDDAAMKERYGPSLRKWGRMPGILQSMGDSYYIACFKTKREAERFGRDAARKAPKRKRK